MKQIIRWTQLTLFATCAAMLAGCWERPPMDVAQGGYRGTGMMAVSNPRDTAQKRAAQTVPEVLAPAAEGGPVAGTVFKNVPVLGGLSVGEFTRTMLAMTAWVSPKEGCNYCHKADDFASDALYTKVVARRMLQMTQAVNTDWKSHVAATGVTCYTCHRGQHVPEYSWFTPATNKQAARMTGNDGGQNKPSAVVGLTALPYDPFSAYLSGSKEIRVVSTTALPTPARQSIKDTEATYGLMVHMSQGLGVNCTYCHNTQSFSSWQGSTPKRVTAWHGIRMARELNNNFLESLTGVFPIERKGPQGDVAKINCETCHQGVFKPLAGAPLAAGYPAVLGPTVAPAAPAAPQTVATGPAPTTIKK